MANSCSNNTTIIVYQCSKCLTILGDTLLEKESNDELGVIGLTMVSEDVTVRADNNLEHRGVDAGSTYKVLRCKCEQEIGRIYVKTTKKFQNLIDLFCLKRNRMIVYEVGKAQVIRVQKTEQDDSARQSIEKLEKMIMILHTRLKNIEDSFEIDTTQGTVERGNSVNTPLPKTQAKKTGSRRRKETRLASSSSSSN